MNQLCNRKQAVAFLKNELKDLRQNGPMLIQKEGKDFQQIRHKANLLETILQVTIAMRDEEFAALRFRYESLRHTSSGNQLLPKAKPNGKDKALSASLMRQPPLKGLIHAALAMLFLIFNITAADAQLKLTRPVGEETIKLFANARCNCSATDTVTVSKDFPVSYRSYFVNDIYEHMQTVPFRIYYASGTGQQLYYISKGFCRNISTLVPLPQPGFYFVRFYDEAKPALIEIDARQKTIYVKAWGNCVLHQ
ncbi:MAG TPA: hypothetical protein ENJ95_03505 [Bacteroidetes bacterium]|nr:hypothetical protein [Bacteroidota bacterium]